MRTWYGNCCAGIGAKKVVVRGRDTPNACASFCCGSCAAVLVHALCDHQRADGSHIAYSFASSTRNLQMSDDSAPGHSKCTCKPSSACKQGTMQA